MSERACVKLDSKHSWISRLVVRFLLCVVTVALCECVYVISSHHSCESRKFHLNNYIFGISAREIIEKTNRQVVGLVSFPSRTSRFHMKINMRGGNQRFVNELLTFLLVASWKDCLCYYLGPYYHYSVEFDWNNPQWLTRMDCFSSDIHTVHLSNHLAQHCIRIHSYDVMLC